VTVHFLAFPRCFLKSAVRIIAPISMKFIMQDLFRNANILPKAGIIVECRNPNNLHHILALTVVFSTSWQLPFC